MAWRPGEALIRGYVDGRGVGPSGGTMVACLWLNGMSEPIRFAAIISAKHMTADEPYKPTFPPQIAGKVFAFEATGDPADDVDVDGLEPNQTGVSLDYISLGWGHGNTIDEDDNLTIAWYSLENFRVAVESAGMRKQLIDEIPADMRPDHLATRLTEKRSWRCRV